MCQTAVGQVLAVEDGEVLVDLGGLERRALSLMVPDLKPGDLVLVGLGAVLGRVEPADRAALERIQRGAADQPSARTPDQRTL
jgi:hydrogenase maturation factor